MIPKGVLDRQAGGGDEILDISERGRNAEGEEIRSDRRLFVQMLAFGDCTDTEILVEALIRGRSARHTLSGSQRSAWCRPAHLQRRSGVLCRPTTTFPAALAVWRSDAETRVHHVWTHLLHRLRGGSGCYIGGTPARAHHRSEHPVGDLVSAAPLRFLRATVGRGPAQGAHGTWRHRAGLWPCRAGYRHPPGLPRSDQGRQRLCGCTDRQRVVSRSRPSCSACARRCRHPNIWKRWAPFLWARPSGRTRSSRAI